MLCMNGMASVRHTKPWFSETELRLLGSCTLPSLPLLQLGGGFWQRLISVSLNLGLLCLLEQGIAIHSKPVSFITNYFRMDYFETNHC